MDVNSINNNINSLNNSNSLHLDKTSESKQISKIDEDGLSLSINTYNQRRDELSLDVQSLNDGIAITKISQNALDKQKEFLSNIDETLRNVQNYNNQNDLKADINEQLRKFNQIAQTTQFKNENLLSIKEEDELNIQINTQDKTFSIEKIDTTKFANELFEIINGNDLTNNKNLASAIDGVQSSFSQIENIYNTFSSTEENLENAAKNSLMKQQELYSSNIAIKQRDFGQDSSDFTKMNILSNQGYLVATQANVAQEQAVKLLS